MTDLSSRTDDALAPRRIFLGQLLSAAAAVGVTACAPAVASVTTAPAPSPQPTSVPPAPPPRTVWDDSWTRRLSAAKHKAVFDSPEINDGMALWQAALVMQGYKDAIDAAAGDVCPVVVMRHRGVPIAFGDALWEKYELGKQLKLKDDATKKPYTRNPFLHPDSPTADGFSAMATLQGLKDAGAVLLACNLAAMGYASQIAARTKQDPAAVREEVRANLAPGVILQPSGIYATVRAQEMGAVFMRAT